MLTLTLQTSDRNSAVAIFAGQQCLAQSDQESYAKALQAASQSTTKPDAAKTSAKPGGSALLLPMVQHCLKETGLTTSRIDLVAVTQGPGMFTPLRVGLVTAKTMAWIHQIPLVGVNVLQALALAATRRHQLKTGQIVEAVVNAQRKQLFLGRFEVTADRRVKQIRESHLVAADTWAESIQQRDCVTGPGLSILGESAAQTLAKTLAETTGQSAIIDPPQSRTCESSIIADIAQYRFQHDDVDDPWTLSPIYFRPSAAEEVRAAKSETG